MNESTVQKKVRLAATAAGVTLFRNNVGVAFYPNGQAVRFGLCEGSSDLIGFLSVRAGDLPPDAKIAVFVACETKKPKARTKRDRLKTQNHFLDAVRAAGGVAVMASSVEEFQDAVRDYQHQAKETV